MLVALDVCLHGTNLHRAGVGAQQHILMAFKVKRVVHRTRGVILGRVQRGEVVPVGFDLGAIGHDEANRSKQLFDTL